MKILEWLRYQFFGVWIWVGHKSFGWHYVDIYSPGKEKDEDAPVVGITFTSSEEYRDKVAKVK